MRGTVLYFPVRQRLGFHLEIDFRMDVGRVDGDMAKPVWFKAAWHFYRHSGNLLAGIQTCGARGSLCGWIPARRLSENSIYEKFESEKWE
jgi:hypothetical protein